MSSQPSEKRRHVGRKGGFELDPGPAVRVVEREAPGMQRLPRKVHLAGRLRADVSLLSDQGMTVQLRLEPDLDSAGR